MKIYFYDFYVIRIYNLCGLNMIYILSTPSFVALSMANLSSSKNLGLRLRVKLFNYVICSLLFQYVTYLVTHLFFPLLTHSLNHTLVLSLSFIRSLTHSATCSHTVLHSLSHSLILSLTKSNAYYVTHSFKTSSI